MLTYAIGDIHGQLEMLHDIHARIETDANGRDYHIIHIGDLVDRGANSKAVIEYLMNGQADGKPWAVLKGNHDRYVENYVRLGVTLDPQLGTELDWLNPRMGGNTTLESFGIDPENDPIGQRHRIPTDILEWLENLPLKIETEKVLFVHAGIRPGVAFDDQDEQDLLWMRGPVFFDHHEPYGKLVIHGHTIVERIEHHGNRIDIDTGAGKFKKLSCIVIEDDAIYKVGKKGRFELTPPEGWTVWGEKI